MATVELEQQQLLIGGEWVARRARARVERTSP